MVNLSDRTFNPKDKTVFFNFIADKKLGNLVDNYCTFTNHYFSFNGINFTSFIDGRCYDFIDISSKVMVEICKSVVLFNSMGNMYMSRQSIIDEYSDLEYYLSSHTICHRCGNYKNYNEKVKSSGGVPNNSHSKTVVEFKCPKCGHSHTNCV